MKGLIVKTVFNEMETTVTFLNINQMSLLLLIQMTVLSLICVCFVEVLFVYIYFIWFYKDLNEVYDKVLDLNWWKASSADNKSEALLLLTYCHILCCYADNQEIYTIFFHLLITFFYFQILWRK